jgi:hypothetical protein
VSEVADFSGSEKGYYPDILSSQEERVMARKIFFVSVAALILLLFSVSLRADTIVLKNGKVIEGDIVEETDDLVAVETDMGTGFFSKEQIASINKVRLGTAEGKIVDATGTIEVLPKNETEWQPAEKGTPLNEGDAVRSGPDSKAVAIFANKVIMAIEQDSKVDLEKLQKSRRAGINIRVGMDKGQLWNDVGKLGTRRAKFYVETPQAVTGVRGTVFTVKIEPDATTRVAVVNGTVDVRTRGMMETPTKVRQNSMTLVAANESPAEPEAISEDFLAQWNQYKSKFRFLRFSMIGGRIGLSPTQTMLAGAGIIILVIIIVVVLVRRRRTA